MELTRTCSKCCSIRGPALTSAGDQLMKAPGLQAGPGSEEKQALAVLAPCCSASRSCEQSESSREQLKQGANQSVASCLFTSPATVLHWPHLPQCCRGQESTRQGLCVWDEVEEDSPYPVEAGEGRGRLGACGSLGGAG